MKKLLMLLVLVPLMTLANTEVVDGITWTYWHYIHYSADADPKLETEILGANPSTGSITIPSTLGGCPVTGIGDSAFGGCTGLTSVTIPSSVTSIGVGAFGLCELLRTIHIGKNGDIDKVKQMLVNLENGTKIKSYTANVTGVLIDSTGYGTATIKKVGTVSVKVAEL